MDTVDFARVVAEFGPSSALLVEPGSSAAAHVPPRWAGIAGGGGRAGGRAPPQRLVDRPSEGGQEA
ncbi:hypothetical protein, partial [Nocardia abscessus]|uniref:hypothetical protein n=1 Tax=Nocardia abscessus TaxID=120957 RepID=UPI0024553846